MKNQRGLMGNRDADGNFVTGPIAGEFPLEEKQYKEGEETKEDALEALLKEAPEEIRDILEKFDDDMLSDLQMYLEKKLMLKTDSED